MKLKDYQQVCGVYKCGNTYAAYSTHVPCPKCGISEYEIAVVGSNDRDVIRNYDWRMESKHTHLHQ